MLGYVSWRIEKKLSKKGGGGEGTWEGENIEIFFLNITNFEIYLF